MTSTRYLTRTAVPLLLGVFILFAMLLASCSTSRATTPATTEPQHHLTETLTANVHGERRKPVVALTVVSRADADQTNVPVTFGQPFKIADVPSSSGLQAIAADGTRLPTQVAWKATHPDGSLRHGIITLMLPKLAEDASVRVGLYLTEKSKNHADEASAKFPGNLNSTVKLTLRNGGDESASIRRLAENVGKAQKWLSGPLANEWLLHGPFINTSGDANRYLAARYYVRNYPAADRTRVEVVVENDWAFEKNPHNITYDVHVTLNGSEVYRKANLEHTTHARWRKVFWVGGDPKVYVQQDLAYLKATGAIPNYDPGLEVPESAVRELYSRFKSSGTAPMQVSIVNKHMPATGGRKDIGPLPTWTVLRLLTMNPRLIKVDNTIGALAGSWPIHLRDKSTGLPVSLKDYPNLSTHNNLIGKGDNPYPEHPAYKWNPNGLRPNPSHEPSLAFVPYLLTGDFYYLEELQFWAASHPLETTPSYRGYDKGLVVWTQVRGQAWDMRTLGQVAYVTPDDAPMKQYWVEQLHNNLAWYNKHYSDNPEANKLGFLTRGVIYNHRRAVAPWQDDFFTWAMGYLVQLGFEEARPILKYKATFPVGRMTAKGFCWIMAAKYTLKVRDNRHAPFYDTFAEAYAKSVSKNMENAECASEDMAHLLGEQYGVKDMSGYPWSPQGFPANMQPALAVAVNAGVPHAVEAWKIFMSRNTKPDYSSYPNWDIVPRVEWRAEPSAVSARR